MKPQNQISIAHWTTWDNKMVISHDNRRAINILLVGLSLCLEVKLLTMTPTILESIAQLTLDTIPEDILWVLIYMLPKGIRIMMSTAVIIGDLFS
ncbi:MAG: hypothetical protein ACQ9MH_15240 [Nitrospinales bacterium]